MSLKRNIQVLAAVAAVFAFSAIAASSALAAGDAPRWTTGTGGTAKTLSAAESIAILTGTSTGSAGGGLGKLEVPGLFTLNNPATKCTVTGNITGSAANTSGTANNIVLHCTEVTVEGLPKCTVENEPQNIPGTVRTTTLHGITEWLEATGDRTGVTFTPATGEPFARLTLTGPECIFNGLTTNVTGTIIGEVENVGVDEKVGKLNFPNPPITEAWSNATPRLRTEKVVEGKTVPILDELKVANKAATFTNTFDIELTGGVLWGVETG